MSLLREIMAEAQGVVNDVLGNLCQLTNRDTGEVQNVDVIIHRDVELYQNHQFIGIATTGTFDRAQCEPMINDRLHDTATGTDYVLDGVKNETPSKIEFILGER